MTTASFYASLREEQKLALATHLAQQDAEYERVVKERDDTIAELLKQEEFNRTLAATFTVSE